MVRGIGMKNAIVIRVVVVTEAGGDAVTQYGVGIIVQEGIYFGDVFVFRLIVDIVGVVFCCEYGTRAEKHGHDQSQTQKLLPMVLFHYVSPFR